MLASQHEAVEGDRCQERGERFNIGTTASGDNRKTRRIRMRVNRSAEGRREIERLKRERGL